MLLELDSVDAFYGMSHILHDVSLNVGEEEIVALLGRNGAGKTTTIRSIMGVEVDVEGRISYKEDQIDNIPSNEVFKRGISWVPEERRTFSSLTVRENLKMGRINSDTDKDHEDAYDEVFDLFPRLEERLEQEAGTMSGGEQQMLSIGRAIMSDPDLLLIDEPLEGLMPKLIPEIATALTELQTGGIAILIAEQKTHTVLDLADRAYILANGEIAYSGNADQLANDEETQREYLGVADSA